MSSVLVVEDEQSLREPLVYILQREGFDVLEAADGPAALIEWQNGTPDLILLDLMLPEVPGVEVCRQIRATSTIPIVFAVANDPVGGGLVASLSRPGGNVTGFSVIEFSVVGKMVEDLAPDSASRDVATRRRDGA